MNREKILSRIIEIEEKLQRLDRENNYRGNTRVIEYDLCVEEIEILRSKLKEDYNG